jgi:hypothetical protein
LSINFVHQVLQEIVISSHVKTLLAHSKPELFVLTLNIQNGKDTVCELGCVSLCGFFNLKDVVDVHQNAAFVGYKTKVKVLGSLSPIHTNCKYNVFVRLFLKLLPTGHCLLVIGESLDEGRKY